MATIKGLGHLENSTDDRALLLKDMWEQIEKLSGGKKVYDTLQEVHNKA